jgi:hypothetical protein
MLAPAVFTANVNKPFETGRHGCAEKRVVHFIREGLHVLTA